MATSTCNNLVINKESVPNKNCTTLKTNHSSIDYSEAPNDARSTSHQKKRQVLIIGDNSIVKNINLELKKMLPSYEIMTILKYNALYCQLICNVEGLTKNFGSEDYVIICGGKLDAHKKMLIDHQQK